MARYYFDFREGKDLFRDNEGTELPGDEAARQEAAQTLAGIMRDAMPAGAMRRDMSLEVRDESGRPLFVSRMVFEVTVVGSEDLP